MSISGLKSFIVGLVWIGVGAFLSLDGYKSHLTVVEESMSVALLVGILMLMCGSVLLLNGFVTNAVAASKP